MQPQLLATASRSPKPASTFGPQDDAVDAAFGLAHFLHQNREIALRVATAALSKLEVAVTAQDKRLYYRGRATSVPFRAGAFRRKVWMGDQQLLQRLVAIESEPFERATEVPGGPPPSSEDGVIRFVKHLFRITVRRNSFYVVLGVGRVLHAYNTVETKGLYDALGGDAGTDKAEDYFRARKAVLIREIRERFGDALSTIRAAHGEERFETVDSARYAGLVRECLERFTPWGTACPPAIPPAEEPRGNDHESEMERMHAILHPDCFGRLTSWLGLPAPATRLEIPALRFASGTASPPGRRGGPRLTEGERDAIEVEIRSQSQRRRRSAAGLLRCEVDGKPIAYLDTGGERKVRFDVNDDVERIEVFARTPDGDTLLASWLPARDGSSDRFRPARLSIVLEDGQRLSFAIRPSDPTSPSGVANVEIAWQAGILASLLRLVSPAGEQRFFAPLRVLAAIGVAGLAAFLVLSPRVAYPPATEAHTEAPNRVPAAPGTILSAEAAQPPRAAPAPQAVSRERDVEAPVSVLALGAIRTMWIEAAGEGGESLPALLGERFTASRELTPARSRAEADSLLRLQVRRAPGGISVEAELRDASGKVVWPANGKGRRYAGAADEISRQLASDVSRDTAAARKASPKRPPS